jgi:hypothetical protein
MAQSNDAQSGESKKRDTRNEIEKFRVFRFFPFVVSKTIN